MIPRVFHRIWLGAPMPARFVEFGERWKELHPEWTFRLWDESNVPPLANQDLWDAAAELVTPGHDLQFRSDVLRYELLERFGGVYIDADLEPLRAIDPLLADAGECFVAWEQQGKWANNAIMGAAPGHPFVRSLVEGLPTNVELQEARRPNILSGPRFLTTQLVTSVRPEWPVVVFPQQYFYPVAYDQLGRLRGDETFPESYAVHWWNNQHRLRGVAL